MVGLTHHTFQVCCIQSPCSHGRTLLTYAAIEETQTLKGRCGSVSCGVPGSWCTQGFVGALWASLLCMRFDSKHDFASLLSRWGFSFPLQQGVSFFRGIQYSPVNGCSTVVCNFGVLMGEDECTSFYSTILWDLSVHWVLRVGESVQLKCCPARKGCSPKVLVLQCWFHLWRSALLPPCLIILYIIRVCWFDNIWVLKYMFMFKAYDWNL